MKIIIACDSFKESMSAKQACHAIEKGIKAVDFSVDCLCIPMADGGEGTTEVLMDTLNAEYHEVLVRNPLGEKINARYGMNKDGTAIMECASCCGLDLVPRELRDPTIAFSYGLGEMIKDAINNGAKKIIIGLGGSGTNDGGFGMLYALSGKFYDRNGSLLPAELQSIPYISRIDLSEPYSVLKNCKMIVASDVDNVYTGDKGATYVFGGQKGATEEQLKLLESYLLHLQNVIFNTYNVDLSKVKKTGAAGGLGGALFLLGAKMMSGIDMVLEVNRFKEKIKDAKYIMTGEGSIDFQTINGKTISGIAKLAKKYNIPVIAFAGRVTPDACNLYHIGVNSIFSITNEAKDLKKALEDGESSLYHCAINVFRLLNMD